MPTRPEYEIAAHGKLLFKEIRRLHCAIYEIMRRLPGAKRRFVDRHCLDAARNTIWEFHDVPGDDARCAAPPTLTVVSIDEGVSGVSGSANWEVRLRIGAGASWAQIVELIIHELAHCLVPCHPGKKANSAIERALPLPQREGHNPRFWDMVVAAHQACYSVSTIPVMPGDRRYDCDSRLVAALKRRHAWARLRVKMTLGMAVDEIRQRQLAERAAQDALRSMAG